MTKLLEWLEELARGLMRRPSLRVRVTADKTEDGDIVAGGLEFEIENVSSDMTSLDPIIRATEWCIEKGRLVRVRVVYDVRDTDRSLHPYQARVLTATARSFHFGHHHAWFRTLHFRPRRGRVATVRLRNASQIPLGPFRAKWEFILLRLLGKSSEKSTISIDEMEAQRRSIGRH